MLAIRLLSSSTAGKPSRLRPERSGLPWLLAGLTRPSLRREAIDADRLPRPLRRLNVDEGPLVVMTAAVVRLDRGVLALGRDADDAALGAVTSVAESGLLGLLRGGA